MPAMKKSTTVSRKPQRKVIECKALALLRHWMRSHDLDTAKLARKLDRSWPLADSILGGHTRPDVDVAFTLRDLAKIPIDAWKRTETRA